MNFMMNPKTVLTVIAVLNALHGILWIFFLPLPEMGEGINRHHLRKDCRLFKFGHFFNSVFQS